MHRRWSSSVLVLGFSLAFVVGVASGAKAEPAKAIAAKSTKLSANGELLVKMISTRTLPSGLGAAATSELTALAKKFQAGDTDGALVGWKKFLTDHVKKLTNASATQCSLWMLRVGLLEPDDELASAADKVRYAREVAAKLKTGIAALEAARVKAKASGKAVKVSVVSVLPYSKFKAGTKETSRLLTETEIGALIDSLKEKQDSISELSQNSVLVLQQVMEKKNQLESLISNCMKAAADAQNTTLGNLKP